MQMTFSGDGWLGIAPANQKLTMRSLDFWRCENGLIRENWVLVDLLHVYDQLGVDVFERMREITVARQRPFQVKYGILNEPIKQTFVWDFWQALENAAANEAEKVARPVMAENIIWYGPDPINDCMVSSICI